MVGSRFTHPAESRYAPIEGEALAVADALDKARHFVLGCSNLTVAVDHRPLVKIFGDRSLEDIPNTRLRNIKERTLKYRFKMVHIPGVKNKASDALSRHPTGPVQGEMMVLEDDLHSIKRPRIPTSLMAGISEDSTNIADDVDTSMKSSLTAALSTSHATTWDDVQEATNSDDTMLMLLDTIESGFPEKRSSTDEDIRDFHTYRDNLHSVDGVVIYKDRLVIPPSLRKKCLEALHAAHQGTTMMTARAEASIFWPGISADIRDTRDNCTDCNRTAPSQAAMPPTPPDIPAYPFQHLCADYFHYRGCNYLVIVDRHSNWPIVERAMEGSKGLIQTLRKTFSTFGIPDGLT